MDKLKCTIKQAVRGLMRDDLFSMAAALAFYAMLSLAPLLILLVTLGGIIGPDTQQKLIEKVQSSMGEQAGQAVGQLIENAKAKPMAMKFSAIAGIVTTLLAATAVLGHLQKYLNRIFGVRLKKGFLFKLIYKRLMSLLLLLGIGLLFLLSVIAGAILSGIDWQIPWLAQLINLAANLILFTLIFMILFTVLPDVRISWKSTFTGGLITAILFMAGSWGISLYLAAKGVSSAYGAAGSLVILLIWIFYSGIIVLFGAEITHSYLICYHKKLLPGKFSEWDNDKPQSKPPPVTQETPPASPESG